MPGQILNPLFRSWLDKKKGNILYTIIENEDLIWNTTSDFLNSEYIKIGIGLGWTY